MRRFAPLLVALALLGCGDDAPADEEQVREVLQGFATAVEEKDYQRLCDEIFAEELLQGLQQIGLPCEVAMRTALDGRQDPKLTVGAVTVDGDIATAEVRTSAAGEEPSSDTLELKRVGDRWRVSALGEDQPEATATRRAGPTGPAPPARKSPTAAP